MTLYQNGKVPLSALVQFDSGGGKHMGPVATRARWYAARARIKARTGITLHITEGWNVYRPYAEQVVGRNNACAQNNCNAAAVPGYSSHGGTWKSVKWTSNQWVDSFAIDVGDYWRVPWAVFSEEMRAVGFLVGAITTDLAGINEPWHIIDLNPYASVAGEEEGDFMSTTDDRVSELWERWLPGKAGVKAAGDVYLLFAEVVNRVRSMVTDVTTSVVPATTKAVWDRTVNRSGNLVPAIQELADAKSNTLLLLLNVERLQASIDALQVGGVTDEQLKTLGEAIADKVILAIPTPQQVAEATRAEFTENPLK